MNRRMTALLLVAAMALTLGGISVFAADQPEPDAPAAVEDQTTQSTADTPDEEAEEAAEAGQDGETPADEDEPADEVSGERADTDAVEEAEIVPDPVGSVSFANLESRLRENNFNMLALEENIAAIRSLDYEKMTDEIRKQINSTANSLWNMQMAQVPSIDLDQFENLDDTLKSQLQGITTQINMTNKALSSMSTAVATQSLEQVYNSLKNTFDDLKDGKMQEDNQALIRQLENAQDQIVMAAESLYIALVNLEMNDQSLDRQLTALDRTIQELELRYELGQISALTLQTGKGGRTSLVSGQQTLQMNIANYKTQLELLIGAELTGTIQLQALPQVTDQQLAAMDLETDLAAAKEASYELFAAQRTLDDAKEDYKDTIKEYTDRTYQYAAAQHTWDAAQYTYSATLQSYELKFRTLYNQVKDYQQILTAAKTALAVEQANYAADQLKYDQGSISKNALLAAQDDLSAAQDTVTSAAIDLFAAYNNYRWAVDYGILN